MTSDKTPLILVVDDDDASRYVTAKTLKTKGFAVIEASTGYEALEKALLHPDLIVLDINLPDINGYEVCKRLRADTVTKTIPVLHLTATYMNIKDKVAGLESGAEGYLTQPVEPSELIAVINSLLRMKRAEKEVIRAAQQWNATFDAINDGISLFDNEGRILKFNKAFQEIIGRPADEITGQFCYRLVHRTDTFIESCPFIRARDTQKRAEFEMMLMNKWFRITVDPVLDAGSQATEFVHVISDITGHRKLEEQLRQSQKLEAVGQLAGGVAHDFNNILTAIIGYAHVMTIKMQPDNPLRHHAAQILEVSDRAAALTQSLLAFSRNHPVYLEALDLNKVVESFKKFLLRVIREDITLRTQFADKAVPIMADRGQIEQILMNLITNARDEIPRGGSIMIDTMLVQIDNEFIQAHGFGKPGQYALLTIADTGRGMDEETRGKIFEPFFTTKDVGKGTGLGLSIVYGIVKGHEGFINVYSEPGKGTTFKIYLPAVSDSRLQKADLSDQRAEIQEPQPAKGETILIAEDNESVRKLSRLVLEGVGYIVIEAVDGQEAVQKFIENKDRVQLVILDAIMPVKNGKEAYNEIKAVNPDIKAIFTSGHIEEIIMQQEAADTEVPFLVKPASPSNLLKKVREALDKK